MCSRYTAGHYRRMTVYYILTEPVLYLHLHILLRKLSLLVVFYGLKHQYVMCEVLVVEVSLFNATCRKQVRVLFSNFTL